MSGSEEPPRAPPVAADEAQTAVPQDDFPIVGIGASAGGLGAFEEFLSGMPEGDPEMAFVLVQHLAPDHKSILSDLLRRRTRMHVFEVEDGVVVEPNCAYIIPPNRDMTLRGGALHLSEPSAPRGQRLPIDSFFRSLADDRGARAVGIVLSGTGSDGALGVRAIKAEGGLVIAQSPRLRRARRHAPQRHRHGRRRLCAPARRDDASPRRAHAPRDGRSEALDDGAGRGR